MSLEDLSTLLMFFSTLVVVACLVAVFSLEGQLPVGVLVAGHALAMVGAVGIDRKSTRLNSSHVKSSYAVFCLKKKIYILFCFWLPMKKFDSYVIEFLFDI